MLVYQRVTGVVTHMAPLVIQLLCQAVVRSQEIAPHDAVQCPKQPGVIGRHQKCREGTQKGDVVVKYVDDVGGVDGHRTGFWKGKHVLWRCFFWGRMAFSGRDDGDDACLELVQWWLIPFGPSGWVCDEHPQLPNMNAQPILNPETMGSQFFVFQSPTQLNWIVTLVTLSRPCSGFLSKNWRHVTCPWPLPTRWGPRGEVKKSIRRRVAERCGTVWRTSKYPRDDQSDQWTSIWKYIQWMRKARKPRKMLEIPFGNREFVHSIPIDVQ